MNTSRSRHAAALLTLAAAASSASATDLYWNQPAYTGNVATAANWNTAADGSGSTGVPHATSATDDLFFNATAHNALGGTVAVDANFSANSLTFNTEGATVISQGTSPRTLLLGGGGITLGSDSGNVNFGTATNNMNVRITTSQTWTNNSATGILTVRIPTTNSGAGNLALTLNAASTGGISFPVAVQDTDANRLSIVIDSAGNGLVTLVASTAANAYRGGTTINRGALTTNGTLGTGAVQLGNITGSSNASFSVTGSTFANEIIVRSGSAGTKTLTTSNNAAVLSGALTVDGNLALTTNGTLTTFSNTISGAGDIIKAGSGALTFSGANTSSGDLTLTTGAFTLAATTGSLTFYIGANGVTNQVNGATTGAVAFNGAFNLNLDDAELITGNSWNLVSLASTVESYGALFSLTGFNDNDADNIWTSASGFSFSETTGILTYTAIPEPSSFALLAAFGALTATACRRKRKA